MEQWLDRVSPVTFPTKYCSISVDDAKAFVAAHKLMAPNSSDDGKSARVTE
jgi:hypothetical protein